MQMVMTSDETQIQIFANWPRSHEKRVTRDNRKGPEYRVVAAIRKLRTVRNCPAGKSWPNHVINEQQNLARFGKMVHTMKNETQSKQWVTFGKNCRTVKYRIHFKKMGNPEKMATM